MEALKVSVEMLDGVVASTDLTLPLDAMLVSAWLKEHKWYVTGHARSGLPESEQLDVPLPLAKMNTDTNGGRDWFWACSYVFGVPLFQPAPGYWNKRFDVQAAEDYMDLRKKATVDIRSGRFKNYRVPLAYYVMKDRKLSWYCVGEAEEIEKLLVRHVWSFGKKRSIGYGRIKKSRRPLRPLWTVEAADEDFSMARLLPGRVGSDLYANRPPYFDPSTLRTGMWPDWAEGLACNFVRRGFFAAV